MKKVLQEYLSFNRSERRGLFVLCVILVTLILSNFFLPFFFPPEVQDFESFRKEIMAFEKGRIFLPDKGKKYYRSTEKFDYNHPETAVEQSKLTPFPFDPNQMDEPGWKKLGLTGRQIRMLMNYRSKGGTFRSKADFKKMFCISPEEYEVLEPYLLLPDTVARRNRFDSRSAQSKADPVRVEINSAGIEDFMKLKGIGEYFARKIVSYRESLGGFLRVEQLMEVPKMDSSRYLQLVPYVTVNPHAIRKINVNTATLEALKQHPYIGYNIALSITSYRQAHGPFQRPEDLKKSALVTEKVYARISPYIRIE